MQTSDRKRDKIPSNRDLFLPDSKFKVICISDSDVAFLVFPHKLESHTRSRRQLHFFYYAVIPVSGSVKTLKLQSITVATERDFTREIGITFTIIVYPNSVFKTTITTYSIVNSKLFVRRTATLRNCNFLFHFNYG